MVAASICAALSERGERVAAFKPAVTGLEQPPADWPPDHELLAQAGRSRQAPNEVAPYAFGPPVSPHHAAELAGTAIEPETLLEHARRLASEADALIAEGVGGLMVPLTPGYLVRDLAVELGMPVVVAARPGLGTINHTLLTVEAARAAGLRVAAVVMTPWSGDSAMECSNRAAVERLGAVEVATLPAGAPDRLAWLGRRLPLDDWL